MFVTAGCNGISGLCGICPKKNRKIMFSKNLILVLETFHGSVITETRFPPKAVNVFLCSSDWDFSKLA